MCGTCKASQGAGKREARTSMEMLHTSFSCSVSSCNKKSRRGRGPAAVGTVPEASAAHRLPAALVRAPKSAGHRLLAAPVQPLTRQHRTSIVSSPSSAFRLLCSLRPNSLRIVGSPLGPSCETQCRGSSAVLGTPSRAVLCHRTAVRCRPQLGKPRLVRALGSGCGHSVSEQQAAG